MWTASEELEIGLPKVVATEAFVEDHRGMPCEMHYSRISPEQMQQLEDNIVRRILEALTKC